MSPQQVRGEPYTSKTDIYSLGVVLYWLMTRTLPLEGKNPMVLQFNALGYEYRRIEALNGYYSRDLRNMCYKMLQANEDGRPTALSLLENALFSSRLKHYGYYEMVHAKLPRTSGM